MALGWNNGFVLVSNSIELMRRAFYAVFIAATLLASCKDRLAPVREQSVVATGQEAGVRSTPRHVERNCDFTPYRPVRVSDWLWTGGVVQKAEPDYPEEAKRNGIQGTVVVRVLINGDGAVEMVCGDGTVNALLRTAAEEAAAKWVFRTPELNGQRLPYIAESLTFKFVLQGSRTPSGR
jgi:TonB family protein